MEIIETKLNDHFINWFDQLSLMEDKVTNIDSKLKKLKQSIQTIQTIHIKNETLVPLQKELLSISPEIVRKALLFRDYRTILTLFKLYYRKNKNSPYPIKIKGVRTFEYYNNGKWIHDPSAHYIKKTLFINFQTVLFKINNDQYIDDLDEILGNQDFILKLDKDNYKKEIFKHIIDELRNYLV